MHGIALLSPDVTLEVADVDRVTDVFHNTPHMVGQAQGRFAGSALKLTIKGDGAISGEH